MKKYGFYPYSDKYMYELKIYCTTDTWKMFILFIYLHKEVLCCKKKT